MIKKLNILMTYAVKWRMQTVMRDFIQNMFDATGPERFGTDFHHSYEDRTLKMWTEVPFDKEWLFYLGASTKRGGDRLYAGSFGEGFKVAALVARRDYGVGIVMESRDWRLEITDAEDAIDGIPVRRLAYDITERADDARTVLTLSGVGKSGYEDFLEAMKGFFYEGNPRFGERIMETESHAVYRLSGEARKEFRHVNGFLYLRYQARGLLPGVPLAVCDHGYRGDGDDRDRPDFTIGERDYSVCSVLEELDPDQSLEALEALKGRWDGKARRGELHTERMLGILVQNICGGQTAMTRFKERYGGTLAAEPDPEMHPDRKRTAMDWFRLSGAGERYRMVSRSLMKLGVPGIEELCEADGGFAVLRKPEPAEEARIRVLERFAGEHFLDIAQYGGLPEAEVIVRSRTPRQGQATMLSAGRCGSVNGRGFHVKYHMLSVSVREELLERGRFAEALPAYLHELLHQYGGDSDRQFHDALTAMNERLIEAAGVLDGYEEEWDIIPDGELGEKPERTDGNGR